MLWERCQFLPGASHHLRTHQKNRANGEPPNILSPSLPHLMSLNYHTWRCSEWKHFPCWKGTGECRAGECKQEQALAYTCNQGRWSKEKAQDRHSPSVKTASYWSMVAIAKWSTTLFHRQWESDILLGPLWPCNSGTASCRKGSCSNRAVKGAFSLCAVVSAAKVRRTWCPRLLLSLLENYLKQQAI